jgi:membrane protein
VSNEKSHRRNDHRGREAHTPTDIPKAGWKDIFSRVKQKIGKDNLSIIAAGVAFYAFLAIFPALAAFVSTYGLLVNPSELQNDLKVVESVLPPQTAEIIESQLQRLLSSPIQLGWGLVGSLVLALWSASKGMKALMEAMNITYDEEETRGTIKFNLVAIGLTVGAIILVIVFLTLIAIVPVLLRTVGLGSVTEALINYSRWPLLFFGGIFVVAVLYRYGPSRSHPQWKWVSVGAVVAVTLWVVGSVLFSLYVSNFDNYDATYGSLGVVIILMMWFLLSAYSILLGSEINAELEHQTARDTTSGQEKPRGERGAYVADTVGQRSH